MTYDRPTFVPAPLQRRVPSVPFRTSFPIRTSARPSPSRSTRNGAAAPACARRVGLLHREVPSASKARSCVPCSASATISGRPSPSRSPRAGVAGGWRSRVPVGDREPLGPGSAAHRNQAPVEGLRDGLRRHEDRVRDAVAVEVSHDRSGQETARRRRPRPLLAQRPRGAGRPDLAGVAGAAHVVRLVDLGHGAAAVGERAQRAAAEEHRAGERGLDRGRGEPGEAARPWPGRASRPPHRARSLRPGPRRTSPRRACRWGRRRRSGRPPRRSRTRPGSGRRPTRPSPRPTRSRDREGPRRRAPPGRSRRGCSPRPTRRSSPGVRRSHRPPRRPAPAWCGRGEGRGRRPRTASGWR